MSHVLSKMCPNRFVDLVNRLYKGTATADRTVSGECISNMTTENG